MINLLNSALPVCVCDECGRPTDAETRNYDGEKLRLCDNCDCDYVWCNACECYRHEDALCRHLFYSEEREDYGGCGSSDWESHKTSFFAVLDKIGDEAAKALMAALRLHRYFHQFRGSIFGYESFTADWWDETGQRRDYGHLFTESLFEEEEEAMAIGVQWLASLWAGTGYPKEGDGGLPMTPEADDRTAEWIEEWRGDRSSNPLAALDWIIFSGLYLCQIDGQMQHLEYIASKWQLDRSAGWVVGNNLYRAWYCFNIAAGFMGSSGGFPIASDSHRGYS